MRILALSKETFESSFSKEKIGLMGDTCFISILDPDNEEDLYTPAPRNLLQVKMWDCFDGPMAPPDEVLTAMLVHIEDNKDCKAFITHCSAGISRSGAVADHLYGRFYDKVDKEVYMRDNLHIMPNLYIKRRLRELYDEGFSTGQMDFHGRTSLFMMKPGRFEDTLTYEDQSKLYYGPVGYRNKGLISLMHKGKIKCDKGHLYHMTKESEMVYCQCDLEITPEDTFPQGNEFLWHHGLCNKFKPEAVRQYVGKWVDLTKTEGNKDEIYVMLMRVKGQLEKELTCCNLTFIAFSMRDYDLGPKEEPITKYLLAIDDWEDLTGGFENGIFHTMDKSKIPDPMGYAQEHLTPIHKMKSEAEIVGYIESLGWEFTDQY